MVSSSYNKHKVKDLKKFTRSELRYIFRRICMRIKQKPKGYFILSKLRGVCGYCNFDQSIQIDYRKLLIPTIIHEVIHDMYPNQWEGWVLRLESKLVNVMKPADVMCLLTLFFARMQNNTKKKTPKKKRLVKKQNQTR